jgi:hypothetical protein
MELKFYELDEINDELLKYAVIVAVFEKYFANNHRSQPDNKNAYPHTHISKAAKLRHQCA